MDSDVVGFHNISPENVGKYRRKGSSMIFETGSEGY